jgi:hypothetical protein
MHYADVVLLWLVCFIIAIILGFWGYNTQDDHHEKH